MAAISSRFFGFFTLYSLLILAFCVYRYNIGSITRTHKCGEDLNPLNFLTLMRSLFQSKILPIGAPWGREAIERVEIDHWLTKVANGTKGPTCLEWRTILYAHRFFPRCSILYEFLFDSNTSKWSIDHKNKKIVGDVSFMKHVSSDVFDTIIATQVFEHVKRPEEAIKELHRILKPGGHLIWTVPSFSVLHGAPFDFYRYTGPGVKHLFDIAGFKIHDMAHAGDLFFTLTALMGYGPGDLLAEDFGKSDELFATQIHVHAIKNRFSEARRPRLASVSEA